MVLRFHFKPCRLITKESAVLEVVYYDDIQIFSIEMSHFMHKSDQKCIYLWTINNKGLWIALVDE